MSLEYCDKCDKMIDLDHDEHWEHFKDKWEDKGSVCEDCKKEMQETYTFNKNPVRVKGLNICSDCYLDKKQMKGGKDGNIKNT